MRPTKGSVTFKILETVNELSSECVGGRVPVTEIYLKLKDNSRESVRVILSQLKMNGFVRTPMRGMYIMSVKGKRHLKKENKKYLEKESK